MRISRRFGIMGAMGIVFAFIALGAWGVGDFLIQRSARKFGDWVALFYITAFASVVLLPFVWKDLAPLVVHARGLLVLTAAGVVMTFASLLDFQALKVGKISVIEPVYAFELPLAAGIATFLLHERLSAPQIVLIAILMLGIFFLCLAIFAAVILGGR